MMSLKDILIHEAESAYKITEQLIRQVTNQERTWTPPTGKNWMTMGQLLMHCASFGCGKAVQGFIKGDWGLPEGTKIEDLAQDNHVPPPAELPAVENVEQALELLEKDKELALKCLTELDENLLLDKRIVAPWGGPELPLFQHLLDMVAHLNQHKGQLFYYLKLMGRNVSTKDLWGV
jgi:hypothetical protein